MKNKIKYFASSLSTGTIVAPLLALAQAPTVPNPPTNLTSINAFGTFLCTVVYNWLFFFLIFLAAVFALVAAYKYLTAGGDPEKVKTAGNTLLYVGIALVVAFIARALPGLIYTFLGGAGTAGGCGATGGAGGGVITG